MKLSALQTGNQKYVLAGFDQVKPLIKQFNFKLSEKGDVDNLKYFKTLLATILSPDCSGMLTDPIYGFDSLKYKHQDAGLVFKLVDDWHENCKKTESPTLIKDWGVEQTRNNFGLAQLELYYHPDEQQALRKKQLVSEIKSFCDYEGIDLFLVLRIYDPLGGVIPEADHAALQLLAANELRKSCSLIGLEYPGDALGCATLTAELDVPWVLMANREPERENYGLLKSRLREVLESGGGGVSVDQLLWHDLDDYSKADASIDWDKVKGFLETTARDRLVELKRIVEEAS